MWSPRRGAHSNERAPAKGFYPQRVKRRLRRMANACPSIAVFRQRVIEQNPRASLLGPAGGGSRLIRSRISATTVNGEEKSVGVSTPAGDWRGTRRMPAVRSAKGGTDRSSCSPLRQSPGGVYLRKQVQRRLLEGTGERERHSIADQCGGGTAQP